MIFESPIASAGDATTNVSVASLTEFTPPASRWYGSHQSFGACLDASRPRRPHITPPRRAAAFRAETFPRGSAGITHAAVESSTGCKGPVRNSAGREAVDFVRHADIPRAVFLSMMAIARDLERQPRTLPLAARIPRKNPKFSTWIWRFTLRCAEFLQGRVLRPFSHCLVRSARLPRCDRGLFFAPKK